jgi:hypothetical protein
VNERLYTRRTGPEHRFVVAAVIALNTAMPSECPDVLG